MSVAVDPSSDLRWRVLSLTAVIMTSYGVGLSFGISFPLTALTLEVWQEPKWMIGLASAAPALGVLSALPLVPRVVARLGPVGAIVCGCSVGAMGFVLMFLFQTAWAWIAIRLAMSSALAIPWLASETWINAVSRDETRGRVIAAYAVAFFLGFLTGPILLRWLGISGPVPFFAAAVAVIVAALPILLAHRLAPPFRHDGARNLRSALSLAPTAMAGGFISGFAEITCLSLIPNVALHAGLAQQSALTLVSIMTAGGILMQFPIGWLADKVPRIQLIIGIAAAFILAVLLLPMLLAEPVAARVLVFLLGGIILGFYTVALAIIGEQVPEGALAAANMAFLVMYQAGAIVGPAAAGLAMTASPMVGFVATMTTLMAVCAAAVVLIERTARRSR